MQTKPEGSVSITKAQCLTCYTASGDCFTSVRRLCGGTRARGFSKKVNELTSQNSKRFISKAETKQVRNVEKLKSGSRRESRHGDYTAHIPGLSRCFLLNYNILRVDSYAGTQCELGHIRSAIALRKWCQPWGGICPRLCWLSADNNSCWVLFCY